MYLTLNRASRVLPHSRVLNGNTLFNDVLDGLFVNARQALANDAAAATLAARFDVIEKDDRFEARIEIPGVTKEDIDVQIDGAMVRVKAAAKAAAKTAAKTEVNASEQAVEGERVLASNRATRSWARNFTLPVEVAEDRAEAAYENGVLTLTLPKKEVVQPKRLAIK